MEDSHDPAPKRYALGRVNGARIDPHHVTVLDAGKGYVARTVSTVARPREAPPDYTGRAFKGLVQVVDFDSGNVSNLWVGPARVSQDDALGQACEWLSAWLIDVRGVQ